jgi:hypothetical protein
MHGDSLVPASTARRRTMPSARRSRSRRQGASLFELRSASAWRVPEAWRALALDLSGAVGPCPRCATAERAEATASWRARRLPGRIARDVGVTALGWRPRPGGDGSERADRATETD